MSPSPSPITGYLRAKSSADCPRRAKPGDSTEVIPRHISQLDGLRAIAILMVLWIHTASYFLLGKSTNSILKAFVGVGGSGVDLFFVLSGFLITGILLDTKQRSDYFPRFYWRRVLRIWPVYYAFLFAVLLFHGHSFHSIDFAPFALYYRNFLGPDTASDIYVGQFWSLCVEEQFYLVWPLIIYFCPMRFRMPVIGTLFFTPLFLRVYLSAHGTIPYVVERLTYCRMDDLVAGAAIAMLIRHGVHHATLKKFCWSALLIGCAGLVFIWEAGGPRSVHLISIGLTFFALIYGGIVGLCARSTGKIASALLGGPFLGAISKRSYAMYVFHLVPLYASYKFLLRSNRLPLGTVPALLVMFGIGLLTYGMAWLSWRYFEEPMLRLKDWEWFASRDFSALNMQPAETKPVTYVQF